MTTINAVDEWAEDKYEYYRDYLQPDNKKRNIIKDRFKRSYEYYIKGIKQNA